MRTWPHWRAVGRALMAARKRVGKDGFQRTWDEQSGEHVFVWWAGNTEVCLSFEPGGDAYRLGVDGNGMWFTDGYFGAAVDTLRVLAALDLIPADIAYAADERYGRCVRCGRLAQWWPAEVEAVARWVHVERIRFDLNPHEAVVAG